MDATDGKIGPKIGGRKIPVNPYGPGPVPMSCGVPTSITAPATYPLPPFPVSEHCLVPSPCGVDTVNFCTIVFWYKPKFLKVVRYLRDLEELCRASKCIVAK